MGMDLLIPFTLPGPVAHEGNLLVTAAVTGILAGVSRSRSRGAAAHTAGTEAAGGAVTNTIGFAGSHACNGCKGKCKTPK